MPILSYSSTQETLRSWVFNTDVSLMTRLVCSQEKLEGTSKQKEAEARLVSRLHQLTHELDHTSTDSSAQLRELEARLDVGQATNARLLEDLRAERQVRTPHLTWSLLQSCVFTM